LTCNNGTSAGTVSKTINIEVNPTTSMEQSNDLATALFSFDDLIRLIEALR
jgi:hypothetical protein